MKIIRRITAFLLAALMVFSFLSPDVIYARDSRGGVEKTEDGSGNELSKNAPWNEGHTDGKSYVTVVKRDGKYYYRYYTPDGEIFDAGYSFTIGGEEVNSFCIDADLNSGLDGYEFDIEKSEWDDAELRQVVYYALHNYDYADARRIICHFLRSKGRTTNSDIPDCSEAVEKALSESIPEDVRFTVYYLANTADPGSSGRYQDFITWYEEKIIKKDFYAAVKKLDGEGNVMSGVGFDVYMNGSFFATAVTDDSGIASIYLGSFENAPAVTVKENWEEGWPDGHERFAHDGSEKTVTPSESEEEAREKAALYSYINYAYGYATLVKKSSSTTTVKSFEGIKYALYRNDGTRIADVCMDEKGMIGSVLKIYDKKLHFEEDVRWNGVTYKCIGGMRYDPNDKDNANNIYYWLEYETNEYFELDEETKNFFTMSSKYAVRPGSGSKYPAVYEVQPSVTNATDKPFYGYYIAVKKVDEKGNVMAGVTFDVTLNGQTMTKALKTGADGIAVLNVGSFTSVPEVYVTENWADKRFVYNTARKKITVYKSEEAARSHAKDFLYTNYAYGYAGLIKKSARTGVSPSMKGIKYELRRANGTRVAEVILNDEGRVETVNILAASDKLFTERIDGELCIGGLSFDHNDKNVKDNYYWVETASNDEYLLDGTRYFFTINAENTVSPGKDAGKYPEIYEVVPAMTTAKDKPFVDYYIAVMKTDEEGNKLNGVTFDVTVNGKKYEKALITGLDIKNEIRVSGSIGVGSYYLGRFTAVPEVSVAENWADKNYIHNEEEKEVKAYTTPEAAKSHAAEFTYVNERYTFATIEKAPAEDLRYILGNDNYSLNGIRYGLFCKEEDKLIARVKLTEYTENGCISAGIDSLADIEIEAGEPYYSAEKGGYFCVGGLTAGKEYYWRELSSDGELPGDADEASDGRSDEHAGDASVDDGETAEGTGDEMADGEPAETDDDSVEKVLTVGRNYLLDEEIYSFTADRKNAVEPVLIKVSDDALYGTVTVKKLLMPEGLDGASPKGAVYRIWGIDEYNSDFTDEFVIDSLGCSEKKSLPFGSYCIVETKAPDEGDWLLDETVYTVKLAAGEGDKTVTGKMTVTAENAEVISTDKARLTSAALIKRSAYEKASKGNPNYDMSGIIYGLYDDKDELIASVKLTMEDGRGVIKKAEDIMLSDEVRYSVLDNDGYFAVGGLRYNSEYYWLEKDCSGSGFIKSDEKLVFKTDEKDSGEVYVIEAEDSPCMGKLRVHKTLLPEDVKDADPAGAKYMVYGADLYNAYVREVLTIGKDGYSDELTLPLGVYNVKEIEGPAKGEWDLDATVYEVEITENGGTMEAATGLRVSGSYITVESSDRQITKKEKIKLSTKASDTVTLSQTAFPAEDTVLMDKVSITGLEKEHKYTLLTRLVDKADGSLITESALKFTADTEKMIVEVKTAFDASGFEGKEVVYFEYLFEGDLLKEVKTPGELLTEKAELLLAKHENINDIGQTIRFPSVNTSVSAKDGGREVQPVENVTVYDDVEYHGLTEGDSFNVIGILMDKKTGEPVLKDGENIISTKTFTAEESDGTVRMEFNFDATGMEEHDVVVFEKIYDAEGHLIARHEDINYLPQTFRVTDQPKTGDGFMLSAYTLVMLLSGAAVAFVIYLKKRKSRKDA